MAAVRYDTPESRVPSDNKQLVLEDYVSELVARAVQAASKDRGIDRLGADDNHSEVASSAAVTPNTHGICLPPIIIKTKPEPHFRNDFFEIGPSKIAGWGAFASRELRHGQVILREAALFTADSTRLFKQYDQLRPEEKQVALSLHANSLAKPGTPRIQAIWATNWHVLLFLGPFTVGGRHAGLFPVAARFNHACFPGQNIDFKFDDESRCLILTVRASKIALGDELSINYGRDRTLGELYMTYGFRCKCGGCPGLSDQDVLRLTSQW
ncbi:SET domain-containing protein [Purpureocillium lilacinum]|uniref:SET domain-containing protein n=1 Tax=Purpureocillium lilacinum TaxID=33203 RepID=A0A179GF40_PURLI|nr:SET domain-containing protein [Purpureocillium lilacinum]OAQ75983.1 SET domain-containing protein [Purpureocillium lilacinum]OAQ83132.1 SET domain-containing protein [Purpureocillium lilacinum]GJN70569.1 hypothetical protein PLICBS_004627 [Purpureocillium lilacinum]